MGEEVYKENSYSYCIPSICSDCENKQKVIESGYMCLLCKKCKEILKHTMEHKEDEYISREILLGAMRQVARIREDRLIPWQTVYDLIMNCPTKEQIEGNKSTL